MSDKTEGEFFLSNIFVAHGQDVKCVVATSSGGLITSSRDATVKIWHERAGTYEEKTVFKQRNNLAVNSVAFYQSPDGEWLLFAGLKDGTIEVFNAASSEPLTILQDHTSNVCVLFIDVRHKLLLSGSWDARAIVWSIDDMIDGTLPVRRYDVAKHKHSVWAISTLPSEPVYYLTGSADRTIKLSNKEFEEIRTFEGHTDVVRSLVPLSETVFISAANDSTVRSWDIETGKCFQTCETDFGEYIYSVCKLELKNGQEFLVAAGEKGYCIIWAIHAKRELIFLQQIRVPVQSVWSVTQSRNTDVVLATSTGAVYVFTIDKNRKANEELHQAFDAEFAALLSKEIENQKSSENDDIIIKVALDDGAPNLELKYTKGTDPAIAAENFIKENNLPISYLNQITEYIKANVPEAKLADAAKYRRQETQREVIDGEKFDYSLEVRLAENGPPFQFGYNIGEDPDFATQRFVEKHKLPVKFMPQLTAFLRSQIPELQQEPEQLVRIGGGGGSFVDPFTGSGRYVPGGIPGNNSISGGISGDPLTGGNRYVPGSAQGALLMPNSSLPRDKKRPRGELVPIPKFFNFGLEGVASKTIPKLREMNDMQTEESKLDDIQLNAMNEIMSAAKYEIGEAHVTGLEIGLKWSIHMIVPILDVFRVAILNDELNAIFCSIKSINGIPPRGSETLQRLSMLLISDPPDPVRILVCRALANAALHDPGRRMLMTEISTLSKIVANQFLIPKATVQVAAASAFANFARLLLMHTETGEIAELGPREDVLRAIINATESVTSFSEYSAIALVRILQAIANLMWGDSTVIGLAKSRQITSIINKIKDSVAEESAKAVARDIVEMIHSV